MSPEELQSLNECFQAMAQSDADKQAPAHVEAALLAAFREQSKPRVIEIRRKRPAWVWLAAAAAVVAVVFAATRAPKPRQEVAVVRPTAPVQVRTACPRSSTGAYNRQGKGPSAENRQAPSEAAATGSTGKGSSN